MGVSRRKMWWCRFSPECRLPLWGTRVVATMCVRAEALRECDDRARSGVSV